MPAMNSPGHCIHTMHTIPEEQETAVFQLNAMSAGYGRAPVIHAITGAIPKGACLAVIGGNGAGKSTFLKVLAGILPPLSGSLWLAPIMHHKIAYLAQSVQFDRDFPLSTSDLLAQGLWRETGAFGRFDTRHLSRIRDALAATGLGAMASAPIGTLSGGQLRRALFARLMLQETDVLLLDEPFAGVDAQTTRDLLKLLMAWHRQGRTLVAVLHDHDLVAGHFETTLWLEGSVKAWGRTQDVLPRARSEVAPLGHVCDDSCVGVGKQPSPLAAL